MNILDVIARVGPENIKVQNLLSSIKKISANKRDDVTVTFVTGSDTLAPADLCGEPRYAVLVVFLPYAATMKARAELKEAEQCSRSS